LISLRVIHDVGHHISVRIGDVTVARYVYGEDAPRLEAPKPYFHPIRTLSGAVVSAYRPHDHRWHKGLQLTISHLSGQNFWGGPTYVDGEGYVQLDNLGSIRHESFTEFVADTRQLRFTEELSWHSSAGDRWMAEQRTVAIHGVSLEQGHWVLDFATRLANVRDEPLDIGSPTTHGRPMAGYTGLFWRGPRGWAGGRIHTNHGEGAGLMGSAAPWLAYTGEHDEVDGGGTLLFLEDANHNTVKHFWFVRNEPFPAVNPSPAFYDEHRLAPRETIALSYRVVIGDTIWERDHIERVVRKLGSTSQGGRG
jgi:hypothetical protein